MRISSSTIGRLMKTRLCKSVVSFPSVGWTESSTIWIWIDVAMMIITPYRWRSTSGQCLSSSNDFFDGCVGGRGWMRSVDG